MSASTLVPTAKRQTAITDVYDEQRRTFLVRYPLGLVVGLGLSGVLAVALTGFLGYPDDAPVVHTLFEHGWPLFLWLAAMLVTLQASIFRHHSLRRKLVASLVTSVISVIIVAIVYYFRFPVQTFIQQLIQAILHQRILLRMLVRTPWLYALINFGIIAIFWLDALHRWRRRSRGLDPLEQAGAQLARTPANLPELNELVAGDLFAGTALALLLALIFRSDVIQLLWSAVHANVTVTGCTVAWPVGACVAPGGGTHNPPTLTFIDLVLALISLPLGLLLSALSALVNGMRSLRGASGTETPIWPVAPDEAPVRAITIYVLTTLWQTVRSIFIRNVPLAEEPLPEDAAELLRSLRNILWPLLTLGGMFAAAFCADDIQAYLHSSKGIILVLTAATPAVIWGIVAHACIVVSAALLAYRARVVENTARLMALVGFTLLLTLWIFTLALWGVNQFVLLTHITSRHPFDPPAWATALSFAALAIFGFSRLLRRGARTSTIQSEHGAPESSAY